MVDKIDTDKKIRVIFIINYRDLILNQDLHLTTQGDKYSHDLYQHNWEVESSAHNIVDMVWLGNNVY